MGCSNFRIRPEPEGEAFKLNWLRGKTADQEDSASTSEEAFFGASLDTISAEQNDCFIHNGRYLVEPKINNGGGQVGGQVLAMVGVVDVVAVMGIGLQLFCQGAAFFTRSNTCDDDDS
jgi:hypothetical protein